MKKSQEPEDDPVVGLDMSSRDMASLIVDALVDGGIVTESNRAKCEAIAAEEIWIRKLLVGGPPGQGV